MRVIQYVRSLAKTYGLGIYHSPRRETIFTTGKGLWVGDWGYMRLCCHLVGSRSLIEIRSLRCSKLTFRVVPKSCAVWVGSYILHVTINDISHF